MSASPEPQLSTPPNSATTGRRVCARGVWDDTVPGIEFDEHGVSNYAHMFERLVEAYPRGQEGRQTWDGIVAAIKKDGQGKRYDCVIGVSGGTDSCYLLHLAKEYGLRPLAVNLDNGWNTDISVKNIKKVTAALDIDLETYVIDYEEIKDLLRAYMRASLPWVDIPTDLAIKAVMYRIASREGIKYVLRGNDFRSEGTQPREWTYGDGRQLAHVHKAFGEVRLKTFPNYTLYNLLRYGLVEGIKSIYPFYYLDYNKSEAQEFLKEQFGWEYYGGHHHENSFTKFAIAYWLPEKFGIDKRRITYSAQVLSGEMSRQEALRKLEEPHYDPDLIERDKVFILKKLDLAEAEFEALMAQPNKSYRNYPSYSYLLHGGFKLAKPFLSSIFIHKPMYLFQKEMRQT